MGLETATWISELVPTNPPGTDKKKQGDDHIRLLKAVMQASLPNASKPFYFPTSAGKTTNYTAVAADQNKRLLINTGAGAVTVTMPALTSADNGWEVIVMKVSTDVNPIFIAPPSGVIISGQLTTLTKTRRAIPFVPFRVMWVEGAWIVERCVKAPVGTVYDNFGPTLPIGFEWANGQTLSGGATNYPDYVGAIGVSVVADRRSRVAVGRMDMGGVSNGLLGLEINGLVVGSVGGTERFTLLQGHLPAYNLDLSGLSFTTTPSDTRGIAVSDTRTWCVWTFSSSTAVAQAGTSFVQNFNFAAPDTSHPIILIGGSITASFSGGALTATTVMSGTIPLGGAGVGHSNLQPSQITNMIVVVE